MKIVKGSITDLEVDAIVNAANGHVGCMGAGVALAIRRAGGISVENEAKILASRYRFNPGSTYYTKAGNLKCKYIIHAVTMKRPAERCSLETVEKCLNSIFERAKQLDCKTVAIPGLGTKTGRVLLSDAAYLYQKMVPSLEQKYDIEATVCDINRDFIAYLKGEK